MYLLMVTWLEQPPAVLEVLRSLPGLADLFAGLRRQIEEESRRAEARFSTIERRADERQAVMANEISGLRKLLQRQWQKVAPTVLVSEGRHQFQTVVDEHLKNLPVTCPKTAADVEKILADEKIAIALVM